MTLQLVGNGAQWRAWCPFCGVGLNWWADDEGTAAAARYAAAHGCR